jgi:hypothetical protein
MFDGDQREDHEDVDRFVGKPGREFEWQRRRRQYVFGGLDHNIGR